jgi:hypothetical protein
MAIRTKLFIFTVKKFHFILFLLSFGPRVHFRGQKSTFWSLIRNMVFSGFPKKIRNKTFYFHCKKNFTLFFFYLVLALESISGVKSRLFSQTPLNIIFSQKLSNCHISLWRKVFFSIFNQFFFLSYQSCPMLRGVTKKIRKPSCLLGTWYLAVFQKK